MLVYIEQLYVMVLIVQHNMLLYIEQLYVMVLIVHYSIIVILRMLGRDKTRQFCFLVSNLLYTCNLVFYNLNANS